MSKSANPGELRTPVRFCLIQKGTDADAVYQETPVNVFGGPVNVKWVNAHGTDALMAMQMQLREPATITCRYSAKITPACVVFKGDDPDPYDIISIDNVEERNRWLEIKVQRRVPSK